MGYRLNHLDVSVFMAGPKPMQTELGIRHRLESCNGFTCSLSQGVGGLKGGYTKGSAGEVVFAKSCSPF